MTDGKPSFGKRNKSTHEICRRCGRHAMNFREKICAACGFGKSAKLRSYNWQTKSGVVSKKR